MKRSAFQVGKGFEEESDKGLNIFGGSAYESMIQPCTLHAHEPSGHDLLLSRTDMLVVVSVRKADADAENTVERG